MWQTVPIGRGTEVEACPSSRRDDNLRVFATEQNTIKTLPARYLPGVTPTKGDSFFD